MEENLPLYRNKVAMGYHRGSKNMGQRFFAEALRRKEEIDNESVKPYLKKLLNEFPSMMNKKEENIAEDALMYSILFQNAAVKS